MSRRIERMTDAQRELVAQNYRLALMAAWRRVQCGDCLVTKHGYDADDMIEMAYEALCLAARTYDIDRDIRFSTYFMMVVKSCYRDAVRAMNACARRPPGGAAYALDDCIGGIPIMDCVASGDEGVHERVERIERNRVLMRAIGRLDARSKRVLSMYVNGNSQKEIGKMLGISQGHVSRMLIAARKKLREEMAHDGYTL